MLLDTLTAFTQPQDWEEDRRPIVWPSNTFLMDQTGFSLSTLKRHARRLAEVGVIAFKDSSNGKRWGRRDADGNIVEAYGFDLAPLAARVAEFESLYSEIQAERALCQRLRRQITVARRMIRARIDEAFQAALKGPWSQLLEHFEELLQGLPRRQGTSKSLRSLFQRFGELLNRVEEAFLSAFDVEKCAGHTQNTEKMDPRGVNSDPHIRITTQLHPVTCNSSEHEEAAGATARTTLNSRVEGSDVAESQSEGPKRPIAIDLPAIIQSCPEFAGWARNLGGYIRDWDDFFRVAGDLRPMIGVSEQAWHLAVEQLGKRSAAAAFALVFEKFNAGEVTSPGGYLRGMIARSGAGELHLERSFYGRLSGMAA